MSIGLGNKLLYFIKMVVTGFGSSLGKTILGKAKNAGSIFSALVTILFFFPSGLGK